MTTPHVGSPCDCSLYSVLKVLDFGSPEHPLHSAWQMLRAYRVGVDDGEGTPVPIPNTEVKLTRVENTWLVTAREDR